MAAEENPTVGGPEPGDRRPASPDPPAQRPPRRPLPSPLAVITAAFGLFLIVLTLLAIQVRNGRDPALGPGPVVPALSQPHGKSTAARQATQIVSRTSPVAP
jgi:hypothetical protein